MGRGGVPDRLWATIELAVGFPDQGGPEGLLAGVGYVPPDTFLGSQDPSEDLKAARTFAFSSNYFQLFLVHFG